MRLASGVVWRCWEDGCVVFSAAGAQTFLLAPEFAEALRHAEGPDPADGLPAPLREYAQRLADLGILEGELPA